MPDSSVHVIVCSNEREMVAEYNRLIQELDPTVKQRFVEVFKSYVVSYGLEGTFARFRDRTVEQVLDEYHPPRVPHILASGERSDTRYTLYDRPDADGGTT
jgi:hypothetical protein